MRRRGRHLCVAAEPSAAMSEAEEVERLKKDLDKCNSIIKVSVRERASERERERNRFLGLTSQSSARIGRSCGAAVCGAGALTV